MRRGARAALAVLTGVLLVQAHTGWAWAALVALVPLCVALMLPEGDGESAPWTEQAALGGLAYVVAGGHMWGLLPWRSELYTSVVAYLGLTGALFPALARVFLRAPHMGTRVVGVASAWVLTEAVRSVEPGFPALLGGVATELPGFGALGVVGGPWSSAWVLAAGAVVVASAVVHGLGTRWPRGGGVVAGALAVATGLTITVVEATLWEGLSPVRMASSGPPGDGVMRVVVVQTAIPEVAHRLGWASPHVQALIDAEHRTLLRLAVDRTPAPDLVIFPESSTGRVLPPGLEGRAVVDGLVGGIRWGEPTRVLFNASWRLAVPEGTRPDREDLSLLLTWPPDASSPQLRQVVAKRQMTPLAEPAYRAGTSWAPMDTGVDRLGVAICWESLYPEVAARLVDEGAEVLVVVSNDAGQGTSTASEFHGRLTRLRAIETGRPLIYVSQAGPSFVIGPDGRTVRVAGLFERGVFAVDVPRATVETPYRVLGRWWIVGFVGVWTLALALAWSRGRSRGPTVASGQANDIDLDADAPP